MAEIVVVGKGPAGISAAIYTVRAGISTTVVGRDGGALMKTEDIENYYGFPQVISGRQLQQDGEAQAKRLGVRMVDDEVVSLSYDGKLQVHTASGQLTADAVILATGASRKTPAIPGVAQFEGKGISHCAVCDAFFYKGKRVAVLGSGDYALHEASRLEPVVESVTILTNGEEPSADFPAEFPVIKTKIKEIGGDGVVGRVAFEDGSVQPVSGVFIAIGVAGSSDLARKLGAATEGSRIVVDENMATNIPGLFAAGDCTGGILQINKAVYEGARAGVQAVRFINHLPEPPAGVT